MAEQQIEVGPVGRNTLPIVVQSVYLPVGQRHSSDGLALAIVAVFVLVDVVTQVDDIVDGILSGRVAECVEEAEWEVAAGIYGQVHLGHRIVGSRNGFGAADWTRDIRIADAELVVVSGERPEFSGFDLIFYVNDPRSFKKVRSYLQCVIDIRACVSCARVNHLG